MLASRLLLKRPEMAASTGRAHGAEVHGRLVRGRRQVRRQAHGSVHLLLAQHAHASAVEALVLLDRPWNPRQSAHRESDRLIESSVGFANLSLTEVTTVGIASGFNDRTQRRTSPRTDR